MKIYLTPALVILFTILLYAQWQADVRLTNDPAISKTSYNNAWCISAEGNFIHTVWYDHRDGNDEIYYKRSTDGGGNWQADTRLTIDTAVSCNPTISVSGQVVHVLWNDFRDGYSEIYYNRSTDDGESWGADTKLTFNAYAGNPSMAVSGSFVHVTWYDERDGNMEEYYKHSLDGGQSWGPDTRLTNNSSNSWRPSISVSGLNVHVVWFDDRDGIYQIYYKHSTNGGNSWGPDTKLTNSGYAAGFPSISTSGHIVNVVWLDTRSGLPYLYYKRSTNDGEDWEADIQLTSGIYSTGYPSVSAIGLIINVVWGDNRNGYFEIYHKRSTDGGESWQADTRLTNKSGNSENPSIAVSGSAVHAVWSDNRDGNSEIYYKCNPTGNLVFINYSKLGLNKNIKDMQSTSDTIEVLMTDSPTQFNVTDVNITIDTVLHTNDDDLEFTLLHSGVIDTIIYQVGGSGDDFILTVLDDSASIPIENAAAPFTGVFKPSKMLSKFNGKEAEGNWILNVYDRATGNTGTLQAWSLNFSLQTIIGIKPLINEIPQNYFLYQNYPNPFNPVTSIQYAVSSMQFVTLKVYDLLGNDIATLVDEYKPAGKYKVEFNSSGIRDLVSGIYFYQLKAGSYIETKKMVLIK